MSPVPDVNLIKNTAQITAMIAKKAIIKID
jgi:hypothetical protein